MDKINSKKTLSPRVRHDIKGHLGIIRLFVEKTYTNSKDKDGFADLKKALKKIDDLTDYINHLP